jgi:hypothetical protein
MTIKFKIALENFREFRRLIWFLTFFLNSVEPMVYYSLASYSPVPREFSSGGNNHAVDFNIRSSFPESWIWDNFEEYVLFLFSYLECIGNI